MPRVGKAVWPREPLWDMPATPSAGALPGTLGTAGGATCECPGIAGLRWKNTKSYRGMFVHVT